MSGTCCFSWGIIQSAVLPDPDLVYEKCLKGEEGFENCSNIFPKNYKPVAVDPLLSGDNFCALIHKIFVFFKCLIFNMTKIGKIKSFKFTE